MRDLRFEAPVLWKLLKQQWVPSSFWVSSLKIAHIRDSWWVHVIPAASQLCCRLRELVGDPAVLTAGWSRSDNSLTILLPAPPPAFSPLFKLPDPPPIQALHTQMHRGLLIFWFIKYPNGDVESAVGNVHWEFGKEARTEMRFGSRQQIWMYEPWAWMITKCREFKNWPWSKATWTVQHRKGGTNEAESQANAVLRRESPTMPSAAGRWISQGPRIGPLDHAKWRSLVT